MITAELRDLLDDVDRHQQSLVTVYEYRANKIGCCSGNLLARASGKSVFLGTGDKGYYVDKQHVIIKDVSPHKPCTISYRVLDDDIELLNIIFVH